MAIRTTCSSCRTAYTLADNLAGKTVRCKKCNDTFLVPSAGAREKIQTRPPAPQRPLARDEEEVRPQRRKREEDQDLPLPVRRSNRGLIFGLIGCGAALMLLLAGGILVGVLLLTRQSGSPSSAPDFVVNADDAIPKPANGARRGNRAPDFLADDDEPPNGDAVTRALHQLKSTNIQKRQEALRKLKETLPDERRAEVIKALVPLLNDPDHFTRQWAVEALGVWGNKDTVPLLLQAMKDPDTRSEAMKALARLKDERAAEPIAQRLEEFTELLEATEALKQMGPVAEKAVLARLNHPEFQVRLMVFEILKVIGTKQSIPALEKVIAAGQDPFSGENHIFAIHAEQVLKAIKARQ